MSEAISFVQKTRYGPGSTHETRCPDKTPGSTWVLEPPPGYQTYSLQVCLFLSSIAMGDTDGRGVGALKADSLQQIVIDCSYIDQKKRSILNMKETHTSMIELLNMKQLKERWVAGKQQLKIIFF